MESHMSSPAHSRRKRVRTPLTVAMMLTMSCSAWADDTFDTSLLEVDNPSQGKVDLSLYAQRGRQAPGDYQVDVLLNGEKVDNKKITFTVGDGENLKPCISAGDLERWGVNVAAFPALTKAGDGCVRLQDAMPASMVKFDFSAQNLLLTVPQAALTHQARGWVAPEKWDDGINALFSTYNLTGGRNWYRDSSGGGTDSVYLGLQNGLNIGPWRLRNSSSLTYTSGQRAEWQSQATYLQRDIRTLKSQLQVGEAYTQSDVFDSVPMRGVQMWSDDAMLPDSMQGYAPVVRGIARTHAQVTIRQNNYIIYQTYVPPGPFTIADLYASGGNGDLTVEVKEADGSVQHSIVPFSSLAMLQREGRVKYNVFAGQYRPFNRDTQRATFGQGAVMAGLSHGVTLYGGVQAASHYQSVLAGIGKNMGPIGAVSLDATQAWSTPKSQQEVTGQSFRLRYGKGFVDTGTNLSLAAYRYSTGGFYSLQELMDSYSGASYLPEHRRSRAEATVSQSFADGWGSVNLSGIDERYWSGRSARSINAGYNNYWKNISWGVSWTMSLSHTDQYGRQTDQQEQLFAFNMSMPLGESGRTRANYNYSGSDGGSSTHTMGLSGTALDDNSLNWSVSEGYSQGTGNSGNLSASLMHRYGVVNGGYSYGPGSRNLNYGLNGSVIVHADGVTFGQPLSETSVLVKVPGAAGVGVNNQVGVKTDWRGYAVVPYASAYRETDVTLNTETLADDVEITQVSSKVIPTRGAIARATFKARMGGRVLLTLKMRDGKAVPFGAMVTQEGDGGSDGIVGESGETYLTGMPESGRMQAKWGPAVNERCVAEYRLNDSKAPVMRATAVCQ